MAKNKLHPGDLRKLEQQKKQSNIAKRIPKDKQRTMK